MAIGAVALGVGVSLGIGFLISAGISLVLSAALTGLGSLLNPAKSGPQIPASLDPGTKVTTKQAAQPRVVAYGLCRINGTIVFAGTHNDASGKANAFLELVIALADHEVESIDEIYFGDNLAFNAGSSDANGQYYGRAFVNRFLGNQTVADPWLEQNFPGTWTGWHVLAGVAYIRVTLQWNRDVFPTGLPEIWCLVHGKKCYDPRNGTTAFTRNAALCIADYLADPRHGLGAGYGTEIDTDALAAAANICEEYLTEPDGTLNCRYFLDGLVDTSQSPSDIIQGLLSAMIGRAVWTGGKWELQAGAWVTPTESYDENDLRDGFTVQNLVGRRDMFNAVKGTFVNPFKSWQPDDFPSVQPAPYAFADGTVAWKDIQLGFTISPYTAQRIALVALKQVNQPLSLVVPFKLQGWRSKVGTVIRLSIARLGWVDKAFEVKDIKFAFQQGTGDSATDATIIGVDAELRETDPSIFDDSAVTAVDPAPNTTLPDPFKVLPPSNLRASEALYVARAGGGVKNAWTLQWDAAPDAFVQSGGSYLPQYRLVGDADWISQPTTTDLFSTIDDIAAGTYEAQVFSLNYTGARSSQAATLPPTPVVGLSAPPSPPVNFTVEAMESFALARCNLPVDLDVREGGSIVFKHSPDTTGVTWDTATTLCPPLQPNAGAWALPLKSGTYLAKFYDSSGIPSPTAASFVQYQASAHDFTTLSGGLSIQAPDFAGVKTDCYVSGGVLAISGSSLISAAPSIAALPSIAYAGGVQATATYDFDAVMDLGSVQRCRLTNTVRAQIISVIDRIAERANNVSTWPQIGSGATGDEADTYLKVASTQDDPAGSPTWTAWQRLDSATFSARAYKFQRVLESYDSTFSIAVSTDDVVAEGV